MANTPYNDKASSVAEFERRVKKQVQKMKKQKKPALGSNEPSGKINKSDMDY